MSRKTSLRGRTMTVYGAIILLLGLAMVGTLEHFASSTGEQLAQVRQEELGVTDAEQLRWSGELIVSAGRGYLLSGASEFLTELHQAEEAFDDGLQRLKQRDLSPATQPQVTEIQDASAQFRRRQDQLFAEMREARNPLGSAQRFESELVPLRRVLGRALDRWVEHQEEHIPHLYAHVAQSRARLVRRSLALLGVLVSASLVFAWVFAGRLERSARQEQQALSAAQEALRARDDLMGMVAHDLRTPLSAITLRARILQRNGDTEGTRTSAASIATMAGRMEHLVKSMLDSATLKAGRFTVNPVPCGVEGLFAELLEQFQAQADAAGVRLDHTSSSLQVRADRERALQVLGNLLGNAVKHTPAGGRIELSVEARGDMARFAICDTGRGIPPDLLPHVFERFWKQEDSPVKGTGLGLYIAKGIVEAHGGSIGVESAPNRGSTFWFTLPTCAEAPLTEAGGEVLPLSPRRQLPG